MANNDYLNGGGEMGKLIREFDWTATPLGPPASWSPSLLTTINIILKAKFPMLLFWGNDLIQFYNDAFRPSFGMEGKHPLALGQKGADCWQEIWPVIQPLIDAVRYEGTTAFQEDALIPIYRNNRMEDVYWTFSYSKVDDIIGGAGGVLVICNETTEKIYYQQQLQQVISGLQKNEARLRFMLQDAPMPIGVLTGRELVVESANARMLEIWGKTSAVIGKPLALALPELEGQPFLQLLDDVYTTGKPFYGNEMRAVLERDGKLQETFTNFVYHPISGDDGSTESILLVASIVTEQVLARKQLENAQDTLKLAHAAAELGTFDLNLVTGQLDWDSRCRTLFGISHQGPVTYEQDFVKGLHPEDKERVLSVIAYVMDQAASNGDYDIEYRTVGAEDGQLRWVRAKGKVYFNSTSTPLRFIGAVLDITESKQNELRKNDFIAMVSHELKTPLTTLKGYTQLVAVATQNKGNEFVNAAMQQIDKQVKKMTVMINGFLNVSRLEGGKIVLNKTSFDVHDLVAEVVDELREIIGSNQLVVHTHETIRIEADYEKIGQVINNLLSNAAKYGREGTPIEISYRHKETSVLVMVRDYGAGMEAHELEKIFDRFYRIDLPVAKHVGGFGIGLYLCASIIEAHGGSIWAESTKGTGSTFCFTLPL